MSESEFPCPCCGYLVFDGEPGTHSLCPICGWEDDFVQLRYSALEGGANRFSLYQAQKNFAQFAASEPSLKSMTRAASPGVVRDPQWRPLDPAIDSILEDDPDGQVGWPVGVDLTLYYYWRGPYPRNVGK